MPEASQIDRCSACPAPHRGGIDSEIARRRSNVAPRPLQRAYQRLSLVIGECALSHARQEAQRRRKVNWRDRISFTKFCRDFNCLLQLPRIPFPLALLQLRGGAIG